MIFGLALEVLRKQSNCWDKITECSACCKECECHVDASDLVEAVKTVLDAFGNCSELPNSSDLVSRSYLLAEYDRQHQGPPGGARKIIEEAPSIAPQRKPGHWIDVGTGMTMWPVKCSVCGIRQSADSKYCPDCGARMLKEGES